MSQFLVSSTKAMLLKAYKVMVFILPWYIVHNLCEIFVSRNIFNLTSILSDISIAKLPFFWVLIS